MSNIVKVAKEEIIRLEKLLKKIDEFLINAPEGCLKWQNKKGKTYYYHQIMRDEELSKENEVQTACEKGVIRKDDENKLTSSEVKRKSNKWLRKYIKKENFSLAKVLAQKQYYISIRPIIEQNLKELYRFMKKYHQQELEEIYDELSIERKKLIIPVKISVKEKIKQWKEDVYEKNIMYPENLRYETNQGDLVRSKSEVIIANILYQHRKDILYKYERALEVVENGKIKTIYPDFTIINVHTGKVIYWEHAGRMDDSHYANEFVRKINVYIENDLLPGRDIILTYESHGNPLDIGVVKKLVNDAL